MAAFSRAFILVVLFLMKCLTASHAQMIDTISANGTPGSYVTGSVSDNSPAIVHDDLIMQLGPGFSYTGWAVFDLAGIPPGATIDSVHLLLTSTSFITDNSHIVTKGYGWTPATDPATVNEYVLRADLNASVPYSAENWVGDVHLNKFNDSGRALISNNIGSKVVIGVRKDYPIGFIDVYGYGGSASQRPKLIVFHSNYPTCSGTPSVGAIIGPAAICPNTAFALSDTGYVTASGVVGQWQSSPAGSGVFTDISGSHSPLLTVAGQTAATDYRYILTCTNGGASDTSNTLTVGMSAATDCYCASVPASIDYSDIVNVTMAGINNSSVCGSGGGPASLPYLYSDYTNAIPPAILTQGDLISFSVEVGDCSGTSYSRVFIYIDYNHNGLFTDPGELVYSGPSQVAGSHIESGQFTVPAGAVLGNTRMRIINGQAADPCSSFSYSSGETEDYTVTISAPACPLNTGIVIGPFSADTMHFTWNAVPGVVGYKYKINTSGIPPAGGTAVADTFLSIGALMPGVSYYFHLRTSCGGGAYSPWTTVPFIVNDEAVSAALLQVGAPCTGTPNGNLKNATVNPAEPEIACYPGSSHSAWYKFIAPLGGAVRISTDHNVTGGSLSETKLGVYSATDSSDYGTFQILGCDDANGTADSAAYNSILYLTNLSPGATYYIKVDKDYSTAIPYPFCIDVMPMDITMLASTPNCGSYEFVNEWTGAAVDAWMSLVDENTGKLIMNFNPGLNEMTTLYGHYNINTGAVRSFNGTQYLDRNYSFYFDDISLYPSSFQFFFSDAELSALGVAAGVLNITGQADNTFLQCFPDFDPANGNIYYTSQSGNGSVNGLSWINASINLPFAMNNVYLMPNTIALNIQLRNITAINNGPRNQVIWTTGNEQKGDYFEVERSADGRSFTTVCEVNANGRASSYSFWDQTPVPGVNYYRLKLMSASGAFSYSKVVMATVNEINGFAVSAYPNPVSDLLSVKVYGQQGSNATVSICDVTGKVIRVVDMSGTSVNINMSSMAQGMYLIKYADSNQSQTIKISKN